MRSEDWGEGCLDDMMSDEVAPCGNGSDHEELEVEMVKKLAGETSEGGGDVAAGEMPRQEQVKYKGRGNRAGAC